MNDELVLIAVLLLGMTGMFVALVWYRRRKEAWLASLDEIEIPIESTLRSLLVLMPSIMVGPVLVSAMAAATDPWARHHALATTLIGIGAGAPGLLVGLRLSRGYRRIGLLRYTPVSLDLEFDGARCHADLNEPYQLDEAGATGPMNVPLQVLVISQGDNHWGFSYTLPVPRKPYGDRRLDRYLTPLLGGYTRVIHERLRTQLHRPAMR